jgi:2,5-furandicarboxylate decarboxylase 1
MRDYLRLVKDAGPRYYAEVKRPLNPRLELGVLQHKLARAGRFPVLYCPAIAGSRLPLVANLLARYEMLGLALGLDPEKMAAGGKQIILEEYRRRCAAPLPPVDVSSHPVPVQETVLRGVDVDLGLLPLTWHAEFNPERYIPIGVTVLRDPVSGVSNCGIYRMQVMGRDRLACMIIPRPGKRGHQIALRHRELHRPMEAAVFIGHHPIVIAGAVTVGPPVDEWALMGALLGEPLELARGITVDLRVPARAEIVIEGVIEPDKMEREGPFSESSGKYGEGQPCYVIRVTAITLRRDAIYHDIHPTHPDGGLWGILPRLSGILDRVTGEGISARSVYLGPEGIPGKGLTYVSIDKRTEEDPLRAGIAALRNDPQGRIAVVVDRDVDVCEESEALWSLVSRRRGPPVTVSIDERTNAPLRNAAAGAAAGLGLAAKLVFDATRPLDVVSDNKVTFPEHLWKAMKINDYVDG